MYLVRVVHEVFKQRELSWSEVDGPPFSFEGDAADLGDEFGAIILFAITLGFLIWQYVSIKRMAQTAEEATEPVHASV